MEHLNKASGNNEWYTPAWLVEHIRSALGGHIDLDPCTTVEANRVIKAGTILTLEQDALNSHWPEGTIFMNPPYQRGVIDEFVKRFIQHDRYSRIALVNNATETKWFQTLARHSNMFCFLNKRVRFVSADANRTSPLQGQVIVGNMIGMEREIEFEWVFSQHGLVLER